MKQALIVGAFIVGSGAAGVVVVHPPAQQIPVPQTTLVDLPGVNVGDAIMSPNGKFIYYDDDNFIAVYDRAGQRSERLVERYGDYLAISSRGDLLAFAAQDESGKQVHIYAVGLDPATGRAAGTPRRVSVEQGDTPSISPDGKWIAFAGYDSPDRRKQRLALIPAEGGPERVLARHALAIEPIRWMPDGRWIYYGAGRDSIQLNYRVPVAGGEPILFLKSEDTYPGLSPDGKLFVVNGTEAQNYVYDATGRKLGEYPSQNDRYAYAWSGPTKILGIVGNRTTQLISRSLQTGQSRTITLPPGRIWEPRWSPDGKQVAMSQVNERGDTSYLLVMNPDGSDPRRFPVPVRGTWIPQWSPDSRWVAFAGPRPGRPTSRIWWGSVGAVEVSSGRVAPFPGEATGLPSWKTDSRGFLIPVLVDSASGTGGKYRAQIHDFSLAGTDRIIRDIRTDGPAWMALSDSTSVGTAVMGGEARIEMIRGGAPVATFPAGLRYSFPTISRDGQWMMFRSGDAQAFHSVHLARTDGSEQIAIPLSFIAIGGFGNPAFLPGNRTAILAGTTESPDSMAYYRVDFTTRSVTRLLTLERAPRFGPQFTVSPDGSTLLYGTLAPPHTSIVELDLSGFGKRAP